MLNLKKTAVAVLALGSSAVFAGTMGPVCNSGNVSVACEKNAWAFGAQALYLKPVSQQYLGFAQSTVNAADFNTYNEYNPKWGWGYKVEGAYHFNTGNDINVNWYHYEKDSTKSYSVFNGTDSIATSLNVEPKWDAINLEFGQQVNFGDMKNIRFHAGAQYVRLKEVIAATPATATASSDTTYKVDGFGPRIGADMAFDLGNGLAVYGNGATSLLVGNSKFTDAGLLSGTDVASAGHKDVMIPELEAKLGAKFGYATAEGELALDAGYMWVNYFNAYHVAADTTDFALSGPYVGLKWVGNV